MKNEKEFIDFSLNEVERRVNRLNARAANLQMKARLQAKELARRRDAHEKIVLGACIKKIGLADWCRQGSGTSKPGTAGFDIPLLLGALNHLAGQLRTRTAVVDALPSDEELRDSGSRLLVNRRDT